MLKAGRGTRGGKPGTVYSNTILRFGEWQDVLRNTVDAEADRERIREVTTGGRPLGDDVFSTHLESILGRRLTPNPVGSPRKHAALAEPLFNT
jgi:hypothetical protein